MLLAISEAGTFKVPFRSVWEVSSHIAKVNVSKAPS